MANLDLQLFQSNYIWFEVHKPFDVLVQDTEVSSNFDYEQLPEGAWRIYIDISYKTPAAAIMVRSGFQFSCEGLSWDDIFVPDMLNPMVEAALQKCFKGFREQCQANHITIPDDLDISQSTITYISEGIIEQYFTYRKQFDTANAYLLNRSGLELSSDSDCMVALKCTFIIMDEVLYNHPRFNRVRNREVFDSVVPMPRYITLKMNCTGSDLRSVQLSFYDTIMFYQCLDCALQMILGDKADVLIPSIENRGLSSGIQRTFLRCGTELFKQLREMLEKSNARIINLEEKHDWNRLIR